MHNGEIQQESMKQYTEYDAFAWAYNELLGPDSVQRFLPVVEQLVLSKCERDARILDLCCGTGQLARALSDRGYMVTGIDGSEEMLGYARDNASAAEVIADDARTFQLPPTFQAVISAFDSLNHVMRLEELCQVFTNVHSCLAHDGHFLLDLNMEDGYRTRWCGPSSVVEDHFAIFFNHSFDETTRIGTVPVTIFRKEADAWTRSDLTLTQRCYPEDEICSALASAGFTDIETYDAHDDFAWPGGVGRTFFLCRHS